MAQSIDITLPKSQVARFPDRCVVCGQRSPGSHVRIVTGSIGWWTWLLWWFGKPFVVKAPACKWCAWKLHGSRFWSLVVTIAIILAALFYLGPYVQQLVPRGVWKLAMMGIVLLCLMPQILLEVFFAPPFNVTAYETKVDYEFLSDEYALEFALLNGRFASTDEAKPEYG